MTRLPPVLTPSGKDARLHAWLNEMRRYVQEHCKGETSAPGQITSITHQGSFSKPLAPPPQSGGSSPLVWG